MSQAKEVNDEVLRAMEEYRIKFGRGFPLVFSSGITARQILADIRRRIEANDPYPDDFMDKDPDPE